jgi:SAM-dependent methyltransferase
MKRLSSDQWQEFYRSESERYDDRRYRTAYGRLFGRLHHEVIAELLTACPATSRILEIACGTGHITGLLQHLGFAPVACDLTPEMMERARARCECRRPSPYFVRADAFDLPFMKASFDVIVTTRFLHLFSVNDQKRVYAECARVLRPGGLLLVDFDNRSAHLAMWIPHAIYNLIRYRRLSADTHFNSPAEVKDQLTKSGFIVQACEGIGGTHLLPFARLSNQFALKLGRLHRRPPLSLLAEQFLVGARRT